MTEFFKRLRFLWFVICALAGVYAMVYAPIKPVASLVIACVAGLAPYIPLRLWFLAVALEWLAFCAVGLYASMDSGFLELGLYGAPVIALAGAALSWLASAFLPQRKA